MVEGELLSGNHGNYCQTSEQLETMLFPQHAKQPQVNSRASNLPGQLLVAIESVVFYCGFRGRETASKILKPIVTYHLPFFISEVCIFDGLRNGSLQWTNFGAPSKA